MRANEDANVTTMAMPPFMRNSNAMPLTLATWQYELLMEWVAGVEASAGPIGISPAAALTKGSPPQSEAAAARRTQVLERLRTAGRQ